MAPRKRRYLSRLATPDLQDVDGIHDSLGGLGVDQCEFSNAYGRVIGSMSINEPCQFLDADSNPNPLSLNRQVDVIPIISAHPSAS
jgi:hypothetical protein